MNINKLLLEAANLNPTKNSRLDYYLTWCEFIENNDKLFYMVGSLHFAGDQGVDDILEDMGYTVEKLH